VHLKILDAIQARKSCRTGGLHRLLDGVWIELKAAVSSPRALMEKNEAF